MGIRRGAGAASLLRAWPILTRAPTGQDAVGLPPPVAPQGRMGRRRSGASWLSSGSPRIYSSNGMAPRGAVRPGEAAGRAQVSTFWPVRPGESTRPVFHCPQGIPIGKWVWQGNRVLKLWHHSPVIPKKAEIHTALQQRCRQSPGFSGSPLSPGITGVGESRFY